MRFIILLSILSAHLVVPLQAEKAMKNSIGLQGGALSASVKDEMASPLTYRGSGALLRLSYRFRGAKNRHSVDLYYSKSGLAPSEELPYGEHSLDHLQAGLAYGYHRLLTSLFKRRVMIYLGGAWDNHFSLRKLYYIGGAREWYGEAVSSLDASPLLEWSPSGKCRLSCQMALPLVALVIRPPYYAGRGPVTPRITSLDRFFRLKSALVLEQALSRRFDLTLTYVFTYYRYPEPQRIQSGMDLITAGLAFKI